MYIAEERKRHPLFCWPRFPRGERIPNQTLSHPSPKLSNTLCHISGEGRQATHCATVQDYEDELNGVAVHPAGVHWRGSTGHRHASLCHRLWRSFWGKGLGDGGHFRDYQFLSTFFIFLVWLFLLRSLLVSSVPFTLSLPV